MTARTRPVFDLVMRPGEGEQLGALHLDIDARLGEAAAIGLVAPGAPDTARANVELAHVEPEARRAHPLHELLGIGPRREHALARRIKHARKPQGIGRENRIHDVLL